LALLDPDKRKAFDTSRGLMKATDIKNWLVGTKSNWTYVIAQLTKASSGSARAKSLTEQEPSQCLASSNN
jgi:hypothetical protein